MASSCKRSSRCALSQLHNSIAWRTSTGARAIIWCTRKSWKRRRWKSFCSSQVRKLVVCSYYGYSRSKKAMAAWRSTGDFWCEMLLADREMIQGGFARGPLGPQVVHLKVHPAFFSCYEDSLCWCFAAAHHIATTSLLLPSDSIHLVQKQWKSRRGIGMVFGLVRFCECEVCWSLNI